MEPRAMAAVSASKIFDNYSKIEPRVPAALWHVLRFATLAITFAVAAILWFTPDLGLLLFWGLIIPVVPALLIVAPGLWRQVCPMAFLNQMPRGSGFSREKTLPEGLQGAAFSIAVGIFFLAVAMRVPDLNRDGPAVALGVLAVLAAAFVGGLIYKGRSGWCGTFCPLGPIQRDYGQAPLVMVRNGYCPTCLGCQKNCYDFNPRAAIFGDMYDDDPRYAGQRRFFMAMMPGMILGYFLQGPSPSYGEPWHFLILLAATCASVGLYQIAVSFFTLNPFRAANLFAGLAIIAFYYFAGPIVVKTLGQLAQVAPPAALSEASRTLGLVLAAAVSVQGWRNEKVFREASKSADQVHVDQSRASLRERLASSTAAMVVEQSSGASFPVAPDQTLLDALEAARVKINFGCRAGMCGADAVAVCEGEGNLSPPGDDELATLRRLGLEGKARLACMCQVSGPVVIDVDTRKAKDKPATAAAAKPAVDPAKALGLGKVVVIGNGVAGLGVVEALRRASPSVQIAVVTDEPHHFYNRMAIGRAIYGRSGLDGLALLPDEWYETNRIEVWRNTKATRIDRGAKKVVLGAGEPLVYDRLVLATGARAASPGADYDKYPNAFVLRTANDALAIRARVQGHQVRKAVVIGGGVLGIEAADALHHLGLDVTILQRSGRLMDRQLDEIGALKLTQYLEAIGVRIVTNAAIESFVGEETLRSLRLASGEEIPGDLFIASVGAVSNAELARGCELEVGRGVKVDAFMRTSDPEIYAVGDVAEFPGAMGGLWPVGSAQAATAAAAILGAAKPYVVPNLLLQLKCDGIDLRSYGRVDPQHDDETFTAQQDDKAWWRLNARDGQLVGAVFVGPPGESREFTKVIKAGGGLDAMLKSVGAAASVQ
jgi:NADPH-dependent 2,4-dienoyl-CoA reductase/sulfur reductase-like enzyme/ferredoxin